uniref:Uncharacterized protein n=1 Tax=Arundo donax TaxID=35708 RepID=A0A0A9FS73_ARUDO
MQQILLDLPYVAQQTFIIFQFCPIDYLRQQGWWMFG